MAESSTDIPKRPAADVRADAVSVRRWLAFYVAFLLGLAVPAILLLHHLGVEWKDLFVRPGEFDTPIAGTVKLLVFVIYLSLACTLLPLPTGWLVAALAMREVALSDSLAVTVALVASAGALGSMIANLHDYHMFTWFLRSRWVGRVRDARLYHRAERWFARRPFTLIVVFNVLPIPVDVVRMLAAGYRYPLRPFAAGSFIGRFVRYAVIAAVTFLMGDHGWIVAAVLLAVAVVLVAGKLVLRLIPSRAGRRQ